MTLTNVLPWIPQDLSAAVRALAQMPDKAACYNDIVQLLEKDRSMGLWVLSAAVQADPFYLEKAQSEYLKDALFEFGDCLLPALVFVFHAWTPKQELSTQPVSIASKVLKDAQLMTVFECVLAKMNANPNIHRLLHSTDYPAMIAEALAHLALNRKGLLMVSDLVPALNRLVDTKDALVMYGVSQVLSLLTSYPIELSPEQKQLKALQNIPNNPEMTMEQCQQRCTQLVEWNALPLLVKIGNSSLASIAIYQHVSDSLVSILTHPGHRGKAVQVGVVRTLLQMLRKDKQLTSAIHALAKIAVTENPNLVFAQGKALEVVKHLLQLCLPAASSLQHFEALMGLTNLASMDDDTIKTLMVSGLSRIQNLQFEDHVLVRRAATECLCNLVFCQSVFETYVNMDMQQFKLVVLLCDSEDEPTRMASSAMLAMLTLDPKVCEKLLPYEPMVEILKGLFIMDNLAALHRCLDIYQHLIVVPGWKERFIKEWTIPKHQLVSLCKMNHADISSAATFILEQF